MSETESEPKPWWRQPATLVVVALFVLAAGVGIGLILSSGDDDGGRVSTTDSTDTVPPTTAPPTTLPPSTTAVTSTTAPARDRCLDGDQLACDELTDDELVELCDNGNGSLDACQVLLARQGDGVPDGPNGESEED